MTNYCMAMPYKRKNLPCKNPADTVRKIQGAPGLWIKVHLCHYHQHVWDEALDWGGAILYREKLCILEH